MKQYFSGWKGMIKGGTFVFLLFYFGLFIYWAGWVLNPKWFVQRYLVPDFENLIENPDLPFIKDQWVLFTATDEFRKMKTTEKIAVADAFFEKRLKEKLKYYQYDVNEFRGWFMGTVTLSLTEAPVKNYVREKKKMEYREYPKMPRPQYWKYLFIPQIYLYSLVGTLGLIFLVSLSYVIVVLVKQYFSGKRV